MESTESKLLGVQCEVPVSDDLGAMSSSGGGGRFASSADKLYGDGDFNQ